MPTPAPVRPAVLALGAGLLVGAATSFGQTYLGGVLAAVANSAAAWLVAPFLVGARMRTREGAAAAGLAACVAQIAGYYATARLRGYAASHAELAFWTACALAGGPLLGAAGHLWRRGPAASRALGGAVLAAVFLAEGAWRYGHLLHRAGTAAAWIGIGVLVLAATCRRPADLRWLALVLPVALVAEAALDRAFSLAA